MSLYVVMGVSGCGKSSVAKTLAETTGGVFLDADDFHTEENKQKMNACLHLNDHDRWNWLKELNEELQRRQTDGRPTFLACSALKAIYRKQLSEGLARLDFIYLKGSQDCIRQRMEARKNHFMPSELLASQFETLEEPLPGEALVVSVEKSLPDIISTVLCDIHSREKTNPQIKSTAISL